MNISLLTNIRNGTINGEILLQFIRQLQDHVAKADEDVCSENEDMRIKPNVYPV
jgi:hypothetical protein